MQLCLTECPEPARIEIIQQFEQPLLHVLDLGGVSAEGVGLAGPGTAATAASGLAAAAPMGLYNDALRYHLYRVT